MNSSQLLAIFDRVAHVPAALNPGPPVEQRVFLAGGELRPWGGPLDDIFSPICDLAGSEPKPRLLGRVPRMDARAALDALACAARAWDGGCGPWPTMSVADRIAHVERFVHGFVARRAEVVRLLMWEIGKPLGESEKEFDRTVVYLRDTIDALKDLDRVSSRFTLDEGIAAQVRRAPLGVALCMGPFNYPLNETLTTLVPALIMGNTVVFKPPKHGVLLYGPLLEVFRDAFPPGVVNSVYGDGAEIIGPMMASGRVDVLAFIGTSRVADIVRRQHPRQHRLRSVLGLDAKNPAIVLADADLDLAVEECALGALSFNGQRCTALKLIFVERRLADRFAERLAERVAAQRIGLPWEDGVRITPLPEPGKPAWLAELVAEASSHGARVVNEGGGAHAATLFAPAVVYPVVPAARLYTEEQFGPVVPIVPFDDVREPIEQVVASNYGQQLALFGTDPETLARLIDPLVNQVCRVNVNSQCQRGPDSLPFTGRKDSAEGTLSVTDALRVFSIRTLVAAKTTEENKRILQEIVRERHSRFLSTDFLF